MTNTAREQGAILTPVFADRVHSPRTRASFWTPVFTGHVYVRPVNTARGVDTSSVYRAQASRRWRHINYNSRRLDRSVEKYNASDEKSVDSGSVLHYTVSNRVPCTAATSHV